MKAIWDKSMYRNRAGECIFRHIVTGTGKELQAFKTSQGEDYREDMRKRPIWFSVNCHMKSITLAIVDNKVTTVVSV